MEHYKHNRYNSWLIYANERSILENILRSKKTKWITKPKISLIEIGCGSGAGAQRLFNILEEEKIEYEYVGYEPLEEMIELFPKNKRVKLNIGDFDMLKPHRKYDLSIASHCLYYVTSMPRALQKLTQIGKKSLIIHHGKRGINEVHKKFKNSVRKGNYIISTSDEVYIYLKQLDLSIDYKIYPTTVDIRPCQDPQNIHGQNLIRFFLERNEISKNEETEVRKFLKNKGDYMVHDMGLFITKN